MKNQIITILNTAKLLVLVCLSLPGTVFAGEGLSSKDVERISAITVMLEGYSDKGRIPASGFVYRKKGESLLIVTKGGLYKEKDEVSAVFFSGSGHDVTVKGVLLCSDESNGISVVEVPMPGFIHNLHVPSTTSPVETMPLYLVGFPFGQTLKENSANPGPAFISGIVSGIDKDKGGLLETFRIDANATFGLMGSAVLDKDGKLMGVVRDSVRGTRIAEVLPETELSGLFEGRIPGVDILSLYKYPDEFKLKLNVSLFDPMNKIGKVIAVIIPDDGRPLTATKKGGYKPIADRKAYSEFTVKGQRLECLAPAGKLAGSSAALLLQVGYIDGKGQESYLEPFRYISRPNEALQPPADKQSASTIKPQADDWLSKMDTTPAGLVVKESKTAIRVSTASYGEADVTKLEKEFNGITSLDWSSDYKALYVTSKDASISKISYPDFIEVASISLGGSASGACLSRQGLLIANKDYNEIQIMDADTLKLKNRMKAVNIHSIVSSPLLDCAFFADENGTFMCTADLASLKNTGSLNQTDFRNKASFKRLSISGNGGLLFAPWHGGMNMFKVEKIVGKGYAAVPSNLSEDIQGNGAVCSSYDGQKLIRCEDGSVYQTANLRTPLFKMGRSDAACFDSAGQIVYSAERSEFRTFDMQTGKKIGAYTLKTGNSSVKPELMLPAPDSMAVVMHDGKYVYLLVSKGMQSAAKADEKQEGLEKAPVKERPEKRSVKYAETKINVGTAELTAITLEGEKLFPAMAWTADRGHFFLATEKGLIRRFSTDSLMQDYAIDIGVKIDSLESSKSYVVAMSNKAGTIFVLSAEDLSIASRIRIGLEYQMLKITAPMNTDRAYGYCSDRCLRLLDLKSGRIEAVLNPEEVYKKQKDIFSRFMTEERVWSSDLFVSPSITPDGKILFCSGGIMKKLSVLGSSLKFEQYGPPNMESTYLVDNGKSLIVRPKDTDNVYRKEIDKTGFDYPCAVLISTADSARINGFMNFNRYILWPEDIIYASDRKTNYILSSGNLYSFSKEGFQLNKYPLAFQRVSELPGTEKLIGILDKAIGVVDFNHEVDVFDVDKNSPIGRMNFPPLDEIRKDSALETRWITSTREANDVVWSPDGKACFVLEEKAVMRLDLPDFRPVARKAFKYPLSGMSVSKNGLLVLSEKLQEILVLSLDDLSILKRIPVGRGARIASLPSKENAFIWGVWGEREAFLDTGTGKMISQRPLRKSVKNISDMEKNLDEFWKKRQQGGIFPKGETLNVRSIADNGTYLICEIRGMICSFRISYEDGSIEFVGLASMAYVGNLTISMSMDGAIACISGFREKNPGQAIIDIYDVTKMGEPLHSFKSPSTGYVLPCRDSGRLIQASNGELLLFDDKSELPESRYSIVKEGIRGNARKILLPVQAGGKMLVLADGSLYWVNLPVKK
ncbi:MAG: serine protease [Victivallales bacterium]